MLKRFVSFLRSRDGMAAVEFAFVAPLLIFLFFGTIEVTEAIDCRARVNNVAATVSDLVAQETSVSNSDMTNVFGAASAILYPFNSTNSRILSVVVSSVVDNKTGNGAVAWSQSWDATSKAVGAGRTANQVITLPTGVITSGSGESVIMTEITYQYSSPTMVFLKATVPMTSVFYSRPRRGLTVTHS
jgi:Flp pilus assembly protein TadG